MFEIEIKSLGKKFSINNDETILEAALRNNVQLPFGCLSGNCGSCKGKVLEGEVDHGNPKPFVLSDEEKTQGFTLFCQSRAKSNLAVDTVTFGNNTHPVKKLPSRVQSISKINPDVIILGLKTPSNQNFNFTSGQYIDIILKEGKRRSYSMANVSKGNNEIELHVRRMKEGTFTEYAFDKMKVKDILRFEGPLGDFCFDYSTDKPVIFVASGTGFAPIKSILEQLFIDETNRELRLYWGGRHPEDLYLADLAKDWGIKHSNFDFIPVVSEPKAEDGWGGRTGFVHAAVMEDFLSLENHQVYACGAPEMVEAAHRDFIKKRKLPEQEFFSDVFTPGI